MPLTLMSRDVGYRNVDLQKAVKHCRALTTDPKCPISPDSEKDQSYSSRVEDAETLEKIIHYIENIADLPPLDKIREVRNFLAVNDTSFFKIMKGAFHLDMPGLLEPIREGITSSAGFAQFGRAGVIQHYKLPDYMTEEEKAAFWPKVLPDN